MLININSKIFKVKSVFTDKDISKGMMNKKFDSSFDGMLFIMSKGQHCFWMKNCLTNLDIIFIEGDIIKKIHHNCIPCKTENCENYCGNGDLVLEVEGGTCKKYDITEGDTLRFI